MAKKLTTKSQQEGKGKAKAAPQAQPPGERIQRLKTLFGDYGAVKQVLDDATAGPRAVMKEVAAHGFNQQAFAKVAQLRRQDVSKAVDFIRSFNEMVVVAGLLDQQDLLGSDVEHPAVLQEARHAGACAYRAGRPITDNPFTRPGSQAAFESGHIEASRLDLPQDQAPEPTPKPTPEPTNVIPLERSIAVDTKSGSVVLQSTAEEAERAGYKAGQLGMDEHECPYPETHPFNPSWIQGMRRGLDERAVKEAEVTPPKRKRSGTLGS